jgi:Ca2+:H+ antiporter
MIPCRDSATLGLSPKDQVLLALTLLVAVITLGTGRTTVLQGIVHLVIFASFLFFAVMP